MQRRSAERRAQEHWAICQLKRRLQADAIRQYLDRAADRAEQGELEYQPTNRERSRVPRLGRTWCWGCDGARVSEGERCPNCGLVHLRGQRDKGRAR